MMIVWAMHKFDMHHIEMFLLIILFPYQLADVFFNCLNLQTCPCFQQLNAKTKSTSYQSYLLQPFRIFQWPCSYSQALQMHMSL